VVTTFFLLSQREPACRRLSTGGSETLREELLVPLARGERFVTVGLAQLTTSRQHGKPVLTARPHGDGFVLDGVMPWVTGAARADHFVTGAVLEDGRQILVVIPRDADGLSVREPLDLMALQGSLTTSVDCYHVFVERRHVLAGPAEQVMASGRSGTGGLETSCLAIGLARAAIDHLRREANVRREWQTPAERLDRAATRLWQSLLTAAGGCSGHQSARLPAPPPT